jgi:hypothetical protein
MALQTQNLVMIGLGIQGDKPPNNVQPPLADGVHLRWAFRREVGFPWHGYYLFRRRHRPGIFNCLSKVTGNLPVGLWPDSTVNTPFGQISSDQSLRLTDDFPPGGISEFDLDGRHYLRFILPPGEPVRRIEAQIGFRAEARVEVTALLGNVPVVKAVVQGKPNDLQTAELEFDTITAIELATGPAALIDLCFVPVSQDAKLGWELVPDLHYPFCLPVTHPDYPANGGLPVDQGAAEALAVSRVLYGPPAAWGGAPFHELHDRLLELVAGGPAATQMAQRRFSVAGVTVPPDPGIRAPTMPEQYPLDLVLIGSLHPAIAQMVGLYWVDQKVEPDVAYDYLILADHIGRLRGDPGTVLALLQETGFLDVDGYIVFNKKKALAPPLAAPQDVRAYALPGAVMRTQGGDIKDATNNAGLRWDRGVSDVGRAQVLLPGRPVMYHLWRADLGDNEPAAAPPLDGYELLTEQEPILVAEPRLPPGKTPRRPPNWPPFPLHTIDTGLKDGWYSYQVNGVDIFGRHSPNSESAAWYQWTPIPEPPPWYYLNPRTPADAVVHPFAVRLLDKVPPPPPTAIEAYALDPADPTVAKDAAYNTWWAALTAAPWYQALSEAQKQDLIGLRVRWQWPEAYMRQAPDTREFRIYYHPGQMNALVGRTAQITPAGATDTEVDTDIPNAHPADTFVGCWLRIGTNAFKILVSQAGSPLRLRVKNVGPKDEVRPRANAPCTLVLPPDHMLATDFSLATNWQERFYVVGYDEHVILASEADGRPLRQYELFLPDPGGPFHNSLPLTTSLAEPIVYAHIGVSAADDKTHTADALQWAAGQWGSRFGNEGPVGPPVKVFRVRREAPQPPAPPPDAEKVFATPADYQSRSYYTYRWKPQTHLKTHVFRALDDAVFKADWSQRPRPVLTAQQMEFFPAAAVEPRWDALKRQQVADELNQLNTFNHDAPGTAQAMTYYGGLSNDSLRVLAGLPGNERAFAQLTIQPLDPQEPDPDDPGLLRWRNRVGPDNPSDFVVDPALRAYVDTLDGRSTNRYFYRSVYVDGANNRSALSLSSPPIWLPNVVPPRAPVFTRVLAGDPDHPAQSQDCKITLYWASNRELDLAEYRLYRTSDASRVRDIRLMDLVQTVPAPVGPTPPPEVACLDDTVQGLVTYTYRLVAVDEAGNVSEPSSAVAARAFDEGLPVPPQLIAQWVDVGGMAQAQVTWTGAEEALLQRRTGSSGFWTIVKDWLPAGNHTVLDPEADPTQSYQYRLRVRKPTGATAIGTAISLVSKI